MRKAKVTYIAPAGESKVVETRGVTFFDGHPQDLNTDDHGDLIRKAQGNPHFDVELGEEQPSEKRKPGRPPKAKDEPTASVAPAPAAPAIES